MNLRNVLSAYSKLRQLTDDESALLETLRGLNDAERESLVVALQPEKVTGKRASKKSSSKSASKSARASGIGATIKEKLQQREPTVGGFADDADMVLCRYQYPKDSPVNSGMPCNQERVNGVHDKGMGYAGYHEFDAGKSAAQPARGKLSTNGGAGTLAGSEPARSSTDR